MIEQNYCGKVELKSMRGAIEPETSSLAAVRGSGEMAVSRTGPAKWQSCQMTPPAVDDSTKTAHTPEKPRESLASPTGFELVSAVTDNPGQPLSVRVWNNTKRQA